MPWCRLDGLLREGVLYVRVVAADYLRSRGGAPHRLPEAAGVRLVCLSMFELLHSTAARPLKECHSVFKPADLDISVRPRES